VDRLGLIYIRKVFLLFIYSRAKILRCKVWKGNFLFKKHRTRSESALRLNCSSR